MGRVVHGRDITCANGCASIVCRYGGSGKIDERRFDEEGYIAQPPCMWGRAEDGLEAPPLVSDVTIKVAVTHASHAILCHNRFWSCFLFGIVSAIDVG